MTYAVSGLIQASDYNGFVGTTAVNAAYADNAAAQNKVAALIGVGYGTRGYGQTTTNVAAVTAGVNVSAGQWNNLRSAMSTLNTHQGSSLTLQPVVTTGGSILYQSSIPTNITTLDTNRNLANVTQMTVSSALTSTTTSWSNIVTNVLTIDFGTANAARYFFNSGGEIRFSGSNVGGTGSGAAAWASLLTLVGTVKMGASTTTYTGSGGTITNNIGYYGLTTVYQQTFIRYGSGMSSGIYYSIQVKTNATGSTNGGNGSLITVTITFNDVAAYAYGAVDGTTSSYVNQYKAGGVLTIASPVYTTVTPI